MPEKGSTRVRPDMIHTTASFAVRHVRFPLSASFSTVSRLGSGRAAAVQDVLIPRQSPTFPKAQRQAVRCARTLAASARYRQLCYAGCEHARALTDATANCRGADDDAQARASNAAVPIKEGRRMRAAAFHFHGGPAAREQAAECLATAALYEAGDDGRGQRAVIQVILNRVRAPGFPATICGAVYQGYNRTTGCQFSFTCDGSFTDGQFISAGLRSGGRRGERCKAPCSLALERQRTTMPIGSCPTGAAQ